MDQRPAVRTFEQCCSPRDHGLGLEAPRGHKLKSWSWSRSRNMGLGLGLGLGLVTKISVIFKTFQCSYSTVFAASSCIGLCHLHPQIN